MLPEKMLLCLHSTCSYWVCVTRLSFIKCQTVWGSLPWSGKEKTHAVRSKVYKVDEMGCSSVHWDNGTKVCWILNNKCNPRDFSSEKDGHHLTLSVSSKLTVLTVGCYSSLHPLPLTSFLSQLYIVYKVTDTDYGSIKEVKDRLEESAELLRI